MTLACNPTKPTQSTVETSPPVSIEGKWILTELDGRKIDNSELQHEPPMLEFHSNEKKVGGSTGCNQFGAAVTIADNVIRFGVMIATRMACTGDLEDRFIKAMSSVNEFKLEKRNLYLLEGKSVKMVFNKEAD